MDNPLVTSIVVAVATSFSISTQADILGIDAGAAVWLTSFSGEAQDGNALIDVREDLGSDGESENVFYVGIEHPVPFVPNIRLQHTDLSMSATTELNTTIDFDGTTFNVGETLNSDADFTHTDATFYWEVVDFIAEVDVGITGRFFSGFLQLDSDLTGVAREDFDDPIPMLYTKIGFNVPLTGFSAHVIANGIDIADVQLFDVTARVNYEAVLGIGVEAGYRIMELDVEDDDILANLSTDGFYAGLSYRF